MSQLLDRAIAALGRLARWMNLAAGWLFVVCAVFITVEVFARNFLGFSTQSTTELSGYMLAVGIAWGLANALAERAHVRIDIFINKLPDALRHHLHAVALVCLLVLAVAMAYGAWYITRESIEFRAADMTGLRTPLAIPQGLWAAGFFVFAALCVVMLARAVLLLAGGRGAEVERLLGSRTYQDEAREVLEAVGGGSPTLNPPASVRFADGRDPPYQGGEAPSAPPGGEPR